MGNKSQKIPFEPENDLPLVDAHCHIPYGRPPQQPDLSFKSQITHFFHNGGRFLISSAIDKNSLADIRDFIRSNPKMGMTVGFAPQTVTYSDPKTLDIELNQWMEYVLQNSNNYLGIGEIGLDFHHAKTLDKRNDQIRTFRLILKKTKHLHKPFILHVRNAGKGDQDLTFPNHQFNNSDAVNQEVLRILENEAIAPKNVVWHCFSGPSGWGKKLTEQGYNLSVPSSAFGFSKWRIPFEGVSSTQLLTETDSHFQHPFQYGAYNEPYNVRYSLAVVAYLCNLTQTEAAVQVIQNVNRIFDLNLTTD